MITLDADSAACHVLTFKDGLLSPLAHDLKIAVEVFTITLSDDSPRSISARFRADSLRVQCAMKDGHEEPHTPSDSHRREIEDHIYNDVLDASRYPEIRFRSTAVESRGDGYVVEGLLEMLGRERNVTLEVRPDGSDYVAQTKLHQPNWGIRPYTAPLRVLKVKPDVAVVVRVPRRAIER